MDDAQAARPTDIHRDGDDLVRALVSPLLDPLFLRPRRPDLESAWYGHVPFAHWIVAACRPRMLVELGTHHGVSYFAFCEALARLGLDGRAYAVDTWAGDEHAGFYGDEVFEGVRAVHDAHFAGFSELLRCRFDEALPSFADGSVDLLHIDGFHTYEAVRADWEAWRPKLSRRAVVMFHDTNVRERDFGVWRLWEELRRSYPGFEFLHGHGLGVLGAGPDAPTAVRDLFALSDPRDVAAVRERFALLGERWTETQERRGNVAAQRRAEASLAGKLLELERARAEREAAEAEAARLAGLVGGAEARERRAAAALAEVQGLLEEARAREAERAGERDALRLDLDEVAEERAGLRLALDAGAADQARLRAELAGLRRWHHAIHGSVAWRAAAPVRALEARFPRLTRGAGRAMRLGALAVTGGLPARLRLGRRLRDEAAVLRATPLFDANLYLARYPDVADAGADPVWHYLWSGGAAGYDPHPLFDGRWYLAQHPELTEQGVNPLVHFVREGANRGWDPHPLFDTAHYRTQEPEAADRNALLHYLEAGAARSRDPNPWFDTDGYWEENIRDAGSQLEPLSHYVMHGAAAGLDPHPLFDTDWYARTYPESAGWNPLAHFLREGRMRGHAPSLALPDGAAGAEPPALRLMPAPAPEVSIIVPTYGRLFDTLRCLHSIALHSGEEARYEVIVVDDRPDAPIAHRLRAVPGLMIEQNPENLGFLRSCNRAAQAAQGRYVLFLNNDTAVHPGWLAPMLRLAEEDPRVGVVGCKLLNADGTVQEAGGIIHRDGWGEPYGRGDDPERPEYNFVREVDVVIGACMLVRTAAWKEAGGFDEGYAPAYYEEFDLAFRLRRLGWRVLYQPASRVTHFDASSYGQARRRRQSSVNHARFCRIWAEELSRQPERSAPPYLARERPPQGGRILVVDDTVPEPDKHAGSIATLHWLRMFRELGMRVTFVPHDGRRPEPYASALQQMGIEVLYGPLDLPAWIAEHGAHLDHVWSARPGVTGPLLGAIMRHAPGRLIYFTHDLHFLREERRHALEGDPRAFEEAVRLRRVEREIFLRASRVITPSSEEVEVIRALAPGTDVRAVPLYAVPATPLRRVQAEEFAARRAVLFVGGYAHPPNMDAALWLAREVMPEVWKSVPEARLLLVGSRPPAELVALAGERVEVAGWVPDLDPVYARARLALCALRYGAGVKGKILSALESGVPVVTTPIGNEGIGLEDGVEALIGTTAEELAAQAVRLLRDSTLCARLAGAGASVLRRRFGEPGARRALLDVLGLELCPCCGHRAKAGGPAARCDACSADEAERSLAEVAIRPWRRLGITSLREAAPLLARSRLRARVPEGPLSEALADAVPDAAVGPFDLVISAGVVADEPGGPALRPGGRWIHLLPDAAEEAAAALAEEGWSIRLHHAGMVVAESGRMARATA